MNLFSSVFAVDAHTTGSPIRVIIGGLPSLRGRNISEKMEDMKKNYDHLRTFILHPPRGCPSLMCAVLAEPTIAEAHYGLFYMDAGGYQPMCGAGTMAVAKVLVENGMVRRTGARTQVLFETGAGIVTVDVVELEDGSNRLELKNAPSFLYAKNQKIYLPPVGEIFFDLVFGGNFFALVDTAQLGFSICPDSIPRMQALMPQIVEIVNQNIDIVHPLNPAIHGLNEVLFIQDTPNADGNYLGQAIFGNAQVDISPCGTGTSGRIAQRYARGLLRLGEDFIHAQAYGGTFTGTALQETTVGNRPAIIPRVSCCDVQITGYNHLIAEAGDRLKYGFSY